jgi:hypothetical protein
MEPLADAPWLAPCACGCGQAIDGSLKVAHLDAFTIEAEVLAGPFNNEEGPGLK